MKSSFSQIEAGDLPPCKADSNYNKRQIPGHTCWIRPQDGDFNYPTVKKAKAKDEEKKESLMQIRGNPGNDLPYCAGNPADQVGITCKAAPVMPASGLVQDLPPCKADSNYNKRQIPGHTCWIAPTGNKTPYPGDDKKKEGEEEKKSLMQLNAAPCTGTNGVNMQDCNVARHHDQNPLCSGKAGEESGRNCVPGFIPAAPAAFAQAEGVCDGNNGMAGQDCRVSRHKDQKPHCTGKAGSGEEPGINCVDPYLKPAAGTATEEEKKDETGGAEEIQLREPVVGGSAMNLPLCNGFNSGKCEEIVDSQKGV